jgi:glyoxylase-like metal-dependent hydrolase (beta-lactamase superfamily II)
MLKCAVSNCYLVKDGCGSACILVDAGLRADLGRLRKRLKSEDVRLVLLTHGHFDHIGAAAQLSEELRIPVAMSREDFPLFTDPTSGRLHGSSALGRLLSASAGLTMRKRASPAFVPSVWLSDGQSLAEFGVDAKAVALAGHTKGSVGVLTSDKEFIVGDAMFNIFKTTGSRLYEDYERMKRCLAIIEGSGAETIYFGHGRPVKVGKSFSFPISV